MNGIIVIDKPAGVTSHDVVSRVRRILKTKRIGHTGTLDPFATGVMVILVGQATRLAQFLDKDQKEYEAVIKFGFETDTGDATGSRIADRGLPTSASEPGAIATGSLTPERMAATLAHVEWDSIFVTFRGEIEQVPPMYSAKKIGGKKLYEHARKGETVERNAASVKIYELEILNYDSPPNLGTETSDHGPGPWYLGLRIRCSAGTYIRTLAEDIGRKIGVPAHLSELRRTGAGKFKIEQSITLEELAEMRDPAAALVEMDAAVSHLPKIMFDDDRTPKTLNGLSTRVAETDLKDGDAVRMADSSGKLIAIGIFNLSENSVRPKVVLL